jgi:agmatine deiminase
MSLTPDETPEHRMPAEWAPHAATWIAWPHHESDWPGKLDAVRWVYAEIVRVLSNHERVEILCHDPSVEADARERLARNGVGPQTYRLHSAPNDRCWLRDSGPTAVRTRGTGILPVNHGLEGRATPASRATHDGGLAWVRWRFNAWAKYDNHERDAHVPDVVQRVTGHPIIDARRPDGEGPLVLEGGAIDTDGAGTLLTTEECLLSDVQTRNPGMSRSGYERVFADYLGIRSTVWLGRGCAGDDTHGHVDDIARFVGEGVVVCVEEPDPSDPNHEPCQDNLRRLRSARDARGRALGVVTLPMPRPVLFDSERLPASYANFYIANGVVLVPTFNDPNDRIALATLGDLFPGREIVGIHAVDLVWGLGTLHCLTQQQPGK